MVNELPNNIGNSDKQMMMSAGHDSPDEWCKNQFVTVLKFVNKRKISILIFVQLNLEMYLLTAHEKAAEVCTV